MTSAAQRLTSLLFPLLWFAMASAMVVERDSYRYAAVLLLGLCFICFGRDLRMIMRDWLALLCIAWTTYVIARFAIGVFVYDENGTSEWLYAFPLLFPGLGVVLYGTRRHLFAAASALVCFGLIGLLVTIDWNALSAGDRIYPLFHKNPIHAAIGCGMLLVTAVFWMLYAKESGRETGWLRWAIPGLGFATVLLCLVGILGAHSKGAWLAVFLTAAFAVGLALVFYLGRWRWTVLVGCLAAGGIAIVVSNGTVMRVAAPTLEATSEMSEQAIDQLDPLAAMRHAVEDSNTPESMRERLKLWTNALDTVTSSPWIGWGNLWQREWRQGTYSDTNHQLLHNGYLEILVRHGALGALMLVLFAVASAQRLYQAWSRDIIPTSVLLYIYSLSFFFFITIASNSNNRLALGESYFLLVGAAVFAVTLAMRKAQMADPTR